VSERPCLYAKPKSWREKGCKKPAKFRVIFGEGFFIDVCEEQVEGYRGIGYKIIELKELKAST